MSFITLLAVSGIGSEVQGLRDNLDNFYNETNMADVYAFGNNFNENIIDDLLSMESTTGVERQCVKKSVAQLDNNPTITLHFLEKNNISRYYPVEGGNIDFNDSEGIWLDARFAQAKNLSIGDKISLNLTGIILNKTVRGLGYSPDYVFEVPENGLVSDFNYQGWGYLSYKAYYSSDVPYNKLLMTSNVDNQEYYDQIHQMFTEKKFQLHLLEKYNILQTKDTSGNDDINSRIIAVFMPREDSGSDTQIQHEIDQHIILTITFPIIFVVVALLILYTTMSRIINHQRTQIGTLKAIGFQNEPIIKHYLTYGFIFTLLGSVLGIIIGHKTIPYIFLDTMQSYYTLPCWQPGFSMNFIFVGLLIVLGSMFCSYLTIVKIMEQSPSTTLKAKVPNKIRVSFLEKTMIWDKLNFNIRWNIRDINRYRLRSFITLFGIIGCTVLLISAFGLYDGINDLKTWNYDDINHYQTRLIIQDNISQSQIDSIVQEVNGTPVMFTTIQIKANNVTKTQKLTVHDKTPLKTVTDKHRNEITLPEDGISISQKTADTFNLKVGDNMLWHLYGNDTWINSTVDAIYADPSTQGITISTNEAVRNNISFKPTEIITDEKVVNSPEGISGITTHEDLVHSLDKYNQAANLIVVILVIFALVLAVVVLYSLGLLGFTEVERDMATLKVLGFQFNDLRKLFITKYLAITIVGFIIGVPTGYCILNTVRNTSLYLYYPINYSLTTIAISFAIVISVSVIINILLSNKLKDIDMVEALKKERE